jgi:hypothetical protein
MNPLRGVGAQGASEEKRRALLAGVAFVLAPVVCSVLAYRGVIGVAFHGDDYLHLYDLVNLGPLRFVVTNFGGHLQLTRNVVYVLLWAFFGPWPVPSMVLVLLTHLLNVALLSWVVWRFTGDAAVASVVAAWWGASSVHRETLGWVSVYGQVLSTTAVLWVLGRIAATAHGRALGRTTPLRCAAAMFAAATSFGTGLAATMVMPLVVWLLVPAANGRRRLMWALGATAIGVLALYVAADRFNVWLFGTPSAAYVVPFFAGRLALLLRFFAQLVMSGTAAAVYGTFFPTLQPFGWTIPLAAVLALALLVLARLPLRAVLGCLLLSLAPYAMIASARFVMALDNPDTSALASRYHYFAPLGIILALSLAVSRLLARVPADRQARERFLAAGYAAAITGWICCFKPVPRWEGARQEVARALAAVDAQVRASPPGADVYIRHQPFFVSDVTSLKVGEYVLPVPLGRFPGVAGLFALFYPTHVREGRHVFFVVDDPAKLQAWRRGRHGTTLLLSPQEMRTRGGRLR